MALYKITNDASLELIKENDFKLEKEIQNLTEKNLETIFGYRLVSSEFSHNSFRIDSLAFDSEASSFVIIEYKRDRNFSVIDQGYAYLSLMINNKADFILEFNEKTSSSLKRDEVDWSQSKVIFVAPSFTNYQKEAINFKDLPIELWEVKRYSNYSISYSRIPSKGAKESIRTIAPELDVNTTETVKVYTEDDHLALCTDEIKELYGKFKLAALNLGNIEVIAKKKYIAFVADTNVADVTIQKNAMKIWINLDKGKLDDPKQLARDVSDVGHWGNGDYELQIKDDENLEYILSLIKQAI